MDSVGSNRIDALRSRRDEMVTVLEALVNVESPSSSVEATNRCVAAVAELLRAELGVESEAVDRGGRNHLVARTGEPRVLLLGHLDTVWPLGTLARWRFAVDDGRATGPGAFDMKAGIVQAAFALRTLDSIDGVAWLLTSDEELGSPSSRELVEECAQGCSAVLVLEPSEGGAVKTGRKGTSNYKVVIEGRASHAGLDPHGGVNATVEAAHQVLAVLALDSDDGRTTVTPTVLSSGTATNVVPAHAEIDVDVRAETIAEQDRIDRALKALRPHLDEARVRVDGSPNRPPMEEAMTAALFERAAAAAEGLGLGPLRGVSVGGGSDGNFTAALGVPTLDGLGAVGAGAHAEGEHVVVAAMPERAALLAELVEELLSS